MTQCTDLHAEFRNEAALEAVFNEMTSAVKSIIATFAATTGHRITTLEPVIIATAPLEVHIDVYYQPNAQPGQLSAIDKQALEAAFDEVVEAMTAITVAFFEATGEIILKFEPQIVRHSPLEFDLDVYLAASSATTVLAPA